MLVKNVSGNITREANFRSRLLFPRGSAPALSIIAQQKHQETCFTVIGEPGLYRRTPKGQLEVF